MRFPKRTDSNWVLRPQSEPDKPVNEHGQALFGNYNIAELDGDATAPGLVTVLRDKRRTRLNRIKNPFGDATRIMSGKASPLHALLFPHQGGKRRRRLSWFFVSSFPWKLKNHATPPIVLRVCSNFLISVWLL